VSAEVHSDLTAIGAEDEAAWRRLAEGRANAFVTPEWVRAWLAEYGDGAKPAIAVAREDDGSLRGVLPMVRVRAAGAGVLRFAGYNLGDVFHPACAEADDVGVATECLEALAAGPGFDGVLLDHVPAGVGWPAASAVASGLAFGRPYRGDVLPWVDLAGASWEDYLASRSRNLRSQVRRKTKALERDHGAVFRLATAETLAEDLAALVELHERRWRGRGGSGALGARPRRFHERFAAAALANGWLRLWVLELRGEPAAALYGWRLGERYAYYQAGFDPGFERESIGLVLLAHTIRVAADEGAPVYDLLRGGEAYKSRFADAERRVHSVALAPRVSRARVALGAESALWHASRRLGPERRAKATALYGRLERFMPGGRGR
jgi:CelD/BcsL family acetyltransferase involved in cellulose biosynthesis